MSKPNLCEGCGLCCMHMRTPPFACDKTTPQLEASLITWLSSVRWRYSQKHFEEMPCVWLDLETGLCRHHNERPEICQDFEVGGDGCNRLRFEYGLPRIVKDHK